MIFIELKIAGNHYLEKTKEMRWIFTECQTYQTKRKGMLIKRIFPSEKGFPKKANSNWLNLIDSKWLSKFELNFDVSSSILK